MAHDPVFRFGGQGFYLIQNLHVGSVSGIVDRPRRPEFRDGATRFVAVPAIPKAAARFSGLLESRKKLGKLPGGDRYQAKIVKARRIDQLPPARQSAYQGIAANRISPWPSADCWAREALSLPMWPGVPTAPVIEAVRDFFAA